MFFMKRYMPHFWAWLCEFGVAALITLWAWGQPVDNVSDFMLAVPTAVAAVLLVMGIAGYLDSKAPIFRYRIVETKEGTWRPYTAQYQRFLVPIWLTISDFHTYKTQNIFGADSTGGYSSAIKVDNKGGARELVRLLQAKVSKTRKHWFEERAPYYKKDKKEYTNL